MAERALTKPEIASQKRVLKLPPAIGDWTSYRPPRILVKKVKTGLYGFDRVSREDLDRALMIHYRFVQDLLKRFKIDLGLGSEFFSCQAEQTTYLNFLRSLSGPVVQGKLTVANIHEAVQFYLDLNLAHTIINHALGSHDLGQINRGLTEAENTVVSTTLNRYLPLFNLAFGGSLDNLAFSLVGSPDVALDPSISTAATFISFSAEVSFGENPAGRIIFGYPGNSLKTLLKAFEEKETARPLNFGRLSSAVLSKIFVPVSGLLGKTTLFTSELHDLETGDVVSLDTGINQPIPLAIGSALKLPAQPGIKNKKKAARLSGFGEEEIEVPPPIEISDEREKAAPPEEPVEEAEREEEFKEEELFPEEEEEKEFEEDLSEDELEEEFPEEGEKEV